MSEDQQLELRTIVMPREEFPEKIQDDQWVVFYTDDITTCAGVRTVTYEHLAVFTFNHHLKSGDEALANIIGSPVYRFGVLEMDRLELDKDVEGMKAFGHTWVAKLKAIATGGAHVKY